MVANLYLGSFEVIDKEYRDGFSPYSGEVVSKVAICDTEDAKKALLIAKKAAKEAKKNNYCAEMQLAFGCCSKVA